MLRPPTACLPSLHAPYPEDSREPESRGAGEDAAAQFGVEVGPAQLLPTPEERWALLEKPPRPPRSLPAPPP